MLQTPAAAQFEKRVQRIAASASALACRVERDGATERDLAVAIELNQAYIDILDDILSSRIVVNISEAERRILYT